MPMNLFHLNRSIIINHSIRIHQHGKILHLVFVDKDIIQVDSVWNINFNFVDIIFLSFAYRSIRYIQSTHTSTWRFVLRWISPSVLSFLSVGFSHRGGRYSYNRRGGGGGGHRPPNRNPNYDQSTDSTENPTATNYASNRNFHTLFRATMLQDPWANMTPQKVQGNGTSLVSDSPSQ